MFKKSPKKSIKVSEACWKALKVAAAESAWTMEGYAEMAIREKIAKDLTDECVHNDGEKK
jgi:hypothetical protein